MTTIVCQRCGMGDKTASPYRPGWGLCCAPHPDTAEQLAEDAASRHAEALRAARSAQRRSAAHDPLTDGYEDAGGGTEGAERSLSRRATRLRAVIAASPPVWKLTTPRALPHQFVPGNQRSLCGLGTDDGTARVAPHGLRGCRPCARAAGITDRLTAVVTT